MIMTTIPAKAITSNAVKNKRKIALMHDPKKNKVPAIDAIRSNWNTKPSFMNSEF